MVTSHGASAPPKQIASSSHRQPPTDIPRPRERYRSRSPGSRGGRGGYSGPPEADHYARGRDPRRRYSPRRDDSYRHRTPPSRGRYYDDPRERDDRGRPPPHGGRGPPLDEYALPAGNTPKRNPFNLADLLKRNPFNLADFLKQPIDMKRVPPYDPRAEGTPRSVVKQKEWATLENGKQYLYDLITDPFLKAAFKSKLTTDLVEMTKDRLFKHKQGSIVVCVSGNMGGGKSATLNSIFNQTIAREGDSGSSCTLISQSFSGPLQGQNAPFLARIIFYEETERRNILASYLRDYIRACRKGDDDDGQPDGPDSDDNPAIRDEVATVMLVLFGDHKECRTKSDVRHFLEHAQSEDDQDILSKLYKWTDMLIRRTCKEYGARGDKIVTLTESTPGVLLSKLKQFAAEPDEGDDTCGPSLWPLVSLIEFHFEDPMTELGISFLDTPGLTDDNRTRKLSAQKWGRQKTHALVITDAMRATDDKSVLTEVKAMRSQGPDRAIVVSPKSDMISDATMPSGSKKLKDEALALKRQRDQAETKLAELDEQIQQCEDEHDDAKLAQLNQTKRKLEVIAKYADNYEKAHRIKMRADYSKAVLQEKLQDVAKSTAPVPVFSVSNKMYSQHLQGYVPMKAPVLTVEETNIPELRRLLCTFPNEARLYEAKYQQEHVLPQLIQRMNLYTSKNPIERKSNLEAHVLAPCKDYQDIIAEAMTAHSAQVRDTIIEPLRQEEMMWTRDAARLCEFWADEFNSGTFLTLMNRYGRRRFTQKNRAVNLSAELVEIGGEKTKALLGKGATLQTDLESMLKAEVDGLTDRMMESLQQDSNSSFVDLKPFLTYVTSRKGKLIQSIQATSEQILDGFNTVRRQAAFSDEDAYLVEAMLPVYEEICVLKAVKSNSRPKPREGWPKYRMNLFTQRVTSINGIWHEVCNGIERGLQKCQDEAMAALTKDLGKIFEDFHDAFESMCEAKGASDPGEAELKDQLRKNLQKAEEHLAGPMARAFDGLWRDFR